MNRKQRLVVVVALGVIALMLIVPPVYSYRGYSFFFTGRQVRQETLTLQILIVVTLAAGFMVFFGGRRN